MALLEEVSAEVSFEVSEAWAMPSVFVSLLPPVDLDVSSRLLLQCQVCVLAAMFPHHDDHLIYPSSLEPVNPKFNCSKLPLLWCFVTAIEKTGSFTSFYTLLLFLGSQLPGRWD